MIDAVGLITLEYHGGLRYPLILRFLNSED